MAGNEGKEYGGGARNLVAGLEREELVDVRGHLQRGCRVQGSGVRVQGSGCRVQGAGFRVQGSASLELADYSERDFIIDNLLVRIHLIIVMIRWTGLAWEYHSLFQVALHLASSATFRAHGGMFQHTRRHLLNFPDPPDANPKEPES